MLLTPEECAHIIGGIEQRPCTIRQVYYLLERYKLVGIKIGQSIRICEEEIINLYDRDERVRQRVAQLTADIKRNRNSAVSVS